MITAMQELIRQCADEHPIVKELAEVLLEKEKEQIINAWMDCAKSCALEEYDEISEKFLAEEYVINKYNYDK